MRFTPRSLSVRGYSSRQRYDGEDQQQRYALGYRTTPLPPESGHPGHRNSPPTLVPMGLASEPVRGDGVSPYSAQVCRLARLNGIRHTLR